ncbi:MAG TPA: HEAT repeat domain-containing protein [Desulfuromonadales bacterium]|nr:HEAT repeat domain-containing protein [Desulfuromonadales bacterium]
MLVVLGRHEWLAESLEKLLTHRHWEVRITAARALAELRREDGRERLGRQLATEEEELVRQELRGLIDSLDTAQR